MPQRQDESITTAAIDAQDTIITREIPGAATVSVMIDGDESADYALDTGADGDNWDEGVATYSGQQASDTFVLGSRYVRLRVTTAAAAGSQATVTIEEAR